MLVYLYYKKLLYLVLVKSPEGNSKIQDATEHTHVVLNVITVQSS